MNVCFFNNYDVSPNTGGVNKVTYSLSVELMRKGVACFLAYIEDNRMPVDIYAGKIKLADMRRETGRFRAFLTGHKIDVVHINYLKKNNLYVLPYIYGAAHELGIPVVQAFHVSPDYELNGYSTWGYLWYCMVHAKPLAVPLKHFVGYNLRPLLSPVYHRLLHRKYQAIYDNNDVLVLLSERMREPFMRYVTDSGKRVMAIANPNTFSSGEVSVDFAEKRKKVLIVSRLDEQHKRISLALRIWGMVESKADDWSLVIVGDGRDEAYYRYLVEKYGLSRVRFEGFKAPAEYYSRASLFMMTSSSEGWGMTLTECMQYGVVPVVFDSFLALRDIVKDGDTGAVVKDNDVFAFADRLLSLMDDDAGRMRMAENGMVVVRRFDLSEIASKWLALYDGLLRVK